MAISSRYQKDIDRHYQLLEYIQNYYKNGDYNQCIKYCLEDIQNYLKFKEAYTANEIDLRTNTITGEVDGGFTEKDVIMPRIVSFETLVKIYDKQGLYDQAIEVCKLAIEYNIDDGTKGGFQGRIERLEKKKSQPNNAINKTSQLSIESAENRQRKSYITTKLNEADLSELPWYISVSFGKSSSENFTKAIALAKQAYRFIEDEYEGTKIYQAIFTQEPKSYLKFIQLYELVDDWKSSFVAINGEIVDRKIVGKLNYCYGDKCRSGRSNFCFGASEMTENPFGCHRLQISRCNHPWWQFSHRENDWFIIHKNEILKRAEEYGTPYLDCPDFNLDRIKEKIQELPDKISLKEYEKLDGFIISPQSLTVETTEPPQLNSDPEYCGSIATKSKSKITTLILCIFLGYLGVHRFYTGKVGTGVLWLVTVGCFGIGWIVDIIMIAAGHFKDAYGKDLDALE